MQSKSDKFYDNTKFHGKQDKREAPTFEDVSRSFQDNYEYLPEATEISWGLNFILMCAFNSVKA